MPGTTKQRQSAYRRRLEDADKTILRIVVSQDCAEKLRAMARDRVESVGEVVERLAQASSAPVAKPAPPSLRLSHKYALINSTECDLFVFEELADKVEGGQAALRGALFARGLVNAFDAPTKAAAGLYVRRAGVIRWNVVKTLRVCGAIK